MALVFKRRDKAGAFVQPVLTSNGVWGGDSFAVRASSETTADYAAWKAVDGNSASTSYWHPAFPVGYHHPHDWEFYNPLPLIVSSIDIWNTGTDKYCLRNYEIYVSDDGSKWTLFDSGTANGEPGGKFTLTMKDNPGYRCWRIRSLSSTGNLNLVTYGEIKINATYQERRYLAYFRQRRPFVQPTLTSNGTWGGDSFAVSASSVYASYHDVYLAFQNHGIGASTFWHSKEGHPHELRWYNPNPLIISNIQIVNRTDAVGQCLNQYEIYACNDDTNWEKITEGISHSQANGTASNLPIEDRRAFKYWKIKSLSYVPGQYQGYWACCNVGITAVEVLTTSTANVLHYCRKFVQPIIHDNGTMGGDTFGCAEETYYTDVISGVNYPQRFWRLFIDDGHEWQINSVDVSHWYWGKFYSPRPLILQGIGLTNTQLPYAPAGVRVLGSNDNTNWEQIGIHSNWPGNVAFQFIEVPIDSKGKAYKYFRVDMIPRDPTAVMVGRINITAIEIF